VITAEGRAVRPDGGSDRYAREATLSANLAIPDTMRAVVLTGHGGLDRLVYRDDVAVPHPAPGEVLIEVLASAVNNTDINTHTSWYAGGIHAAMSADAGRDGFTATAISSTGWSGGSLSFPRIQGGDVCGIIAAVGEDVPVTRIGQRVICDIWFRDPADPDNPWKAGCIGSERDGGFAEYVAVPAEIAHAIRVDLTPAEIASFPCAYVTGENMVARARVAPGNMVLVNGASGGVGSAAIQLCRRRGAEVIGIAGASKHEAIRALGARDCIARNTPNLATDLARLAPDGLVDVVIDPVSGPMFGALIHALAKGGRYAACGAIAGPDVSFDARDLIYRDLEFYGATVPGPQIFPNLVGYIERGEIRPVVAAEYGLSQLRDAQERFMAKDFVGKIVIDVTR